MKLSLLVFAFGLILCGVAHAGGTPSQFTGAGVFDQFNFHLKPCTQFGQPGFTPVGKVAAGSVNGIVEASGDSIYDQFSSTDPWGFSMWANVWLTNPNHYGPVTVELDTHHGPNCQAIGGNPVTFSNCVNEVKPAVTIPASSTIELSVQTFDDAMADNAVGNSFVTFEPIGGSVACDETDWGQAGYDQVPGNE